MTRFIAYLGLTGAALGLTLGQYWFTFGLWPQNWWTFFGFGFLLVVLAVIRDRVQKESKS